jgi:RNA polymerase sigma-70 factor, ECF subfamily
LIEASINFWKKPMREQLLHDIEELIPVLRRYSRFLVRDPHNADDLVQDSLERAVCHLDQFGAGTSLRAWLLTMMCSCLVARGQREKGGNERGLDNAPCEKAWPPVREERNLLIEELSEAFLDLPDSQKLAMICVIFEGLRYDEAAEVLQVPVGTLRSRVARGREALRRAIAADPLLESA